MPRSNAMPGRGRADRDMQAQILDRAVDLAVVICGQRQGDHRIGDDEIESRLAFFRKTVETLVADFRLVRDDTDRGGGAEAWRRRLRELTRG